MKPLLIISHTFRFSLVVLSLLISTAGCAESMRYRYISLKDVESIRVTRQEQPDLKHFHLMEATFPTSYELTRPAYQLNFRIATEVFAPHIWIEATTPAGDPLLLKPRFDRLPKGEHPRPCGTYSTSKPTAELRFDWVICGTDAVAGEMVVAFDVVDANGTTVGEEDLPFKLVNNGFYFPPDGP